MTQSLTISAVVLSSFSTILATDCNVVIVRGHQRRCSDPSASLDTWLRGGVRPKVKEAGAGRVRHPSETQDIMDKWMAGAVEIAAGDLRDQLDDGATNPVWTMRGNTQVTPQYFTRITRKSG